MIRKVSIPHGVAKELRKVPHHVARNLHGWIDAVETDGLEEVRKIPGFHDEPLKGRRKGQRSIRLTKAYRAIYEVRTNDQNVEYVEITEVHKHAY